MNRFRFHAGAALVLGLVVLAPAAALAQGATDSTTTPAVSGVEEANPALALIPLRPQAEITADINAAKADVAAAEDDLVPARSRAVVAKGQLNIQKGEIETLEARTKLAKQTKNEGELATLKASMDAMKRKLAYLARTEEAMRADVDRLEATRDAARATTTMYERELELAMLRTSAAVTGADPRLADLVRRTLEAQRTAADRHADAAARAKTAAQQQLDQLKALEKLSAPAKR